VMEDYGLTKEELELLRKGKPIAAIAKVRARTGMNLRDSKKLIDKFRNKG